MLIKAPVRDEREVSVSGSATLLRWFHATTRVDVVPAEQGQVSDVLAFYARMVRKYNSIPPVDEHNHERPIEHNSF